MSNPETDKMRRLLIERRSWLFQNAPSCAVCFAHMKLIEATNPSQWECRTCKVQQISHDHDIERAAKA